MRGGRNAAKRLKGCAAILLLALPGAGPAAAVVHGLAGNARFQVGAGLPVPLTAAPAPQGRLLAVSGATVMQTGPPPHRLSIPPGALAAEAEVWTLPVFLAYSKVFQVRTAISARFPRTMTASGGGAAPVVFSAGGRTGGPTETYCAGSGPSPPFDCLFPSEGTINGLMRYTATKSQFGGPGHAGFGGSADVALRAGAAAPCSGTALCLVSMVLATPHPTAAQGAAFGFGFADPRPAPASGRLRVTATYQGGIVAATATEGMEPGLASTVVSYGGPWTTGMLTVSTSNNIGVSPQIFVLSGSDRRNPAGRGSLSLVSGSVSRRTFEGDMANRGWLNLQIGPPPGAHVPALPLPVAAALFGSLAGGAGALLRRRRRS